MPCDIGLEALGAYGSGLAGCWKRPGCLRVQSRLSRRGRSCRGSSRGGLGSGCFRGFLRSRLFGCLFSCGLFGRWFLRYGGLLGSSLLGRSSFLRSSLLGRSSLLCSSLLGRSSLLCSSLLRRSSSLLRWCGLLSRSSLLCSSLLRRSRSLLRRCSSLLHGCGLLSGRFFRSCHYFLLDQVTKSTSCRWIARSDAWRWASAQRHERGDTRRQQLLRVVRWLVEFQ